VESDHRNNQATNHSDVNDTSTGEYLLSEGEIPSSKYSLGEGEAPIKRYLLGDLTPEERQQIEVRLLTDDEFHERVGIIEDELIDEYLYGELPEDERQRFDGILQSVPEQYRKLQLAEDLRTHALGTRVARAKTPAVERSKESSWWRALTAFLRLKNPVVGFSLALALLLSMLGGLWLLTKVQRLEGQLAQQDGTQRPATQGREQELQRQLEQQSARLDELTAELQSVQEQRARLNDEIAALKTQEGQRPSTINNRKPAPAASAVASLFLPLVQGRSSGQTPTLDISPSTARAQLILDLDVLNPASYKSFEAEVKEVNGPTIWSSDKLSGQKRGGSNRIILSMPAGRLGAGDYQVKLNGMIESGEQEAIGIYYFRVRTNIPYAQENGRDSIIFKPTP